jgi:DNA-binding IclR family transcriptional regulator
MEEKATPAAGESIFIKSMQVMRHIVAERGPITLKDLAHDLGILAPTAHRVIGHLESQGWVVWDRERCIMEIGPTMIGISVAVCARYGIEGAIRPLLKSLVKECGETVCLHIHDSKAGQLIAYVVEESDRPLSYRITPGETTYLHTGASGRAVLAFLAKSEFDETIRRHGLPALTPQTITKLPALRRALQVVRKDGFAFSKSERIDGAIGIAAPVFNTAGQIRGSLIISVPKFRFSAKDKTLLARKAIACAASLSMLADLGIGSI